VALRARRPDAADRGVAGREVDGVEKESATREPLTPALSRGERGKTLTPALSRREREKPLTPALSRGERGKTLTPALSRREREKRDGSVDRVRMTIFRIARSWRIAEEAEPP
jgi:hypothetical protein